MIEYGERLKAAMDARSMSVSQLASGMGVSYQAVKRALDGLSKAFSAANNAKAAAFLKVNPDWLATGEGSMAAGTSHSNIIALHAEDDLPDGYIKIPEYKVHFSAGNGSVAVSYELEECSEPATYRLSWLQQERLSPEKLKRFKVKNGSMEPFLFHGDSVLVNEAENTLEQVIDGKVYAIRYGNELRVKRLYYRRISGEVVLHSDNPAYKDEEVMASQFNEQISIIGRVRDKSGTGGL